MSSVALNGFLIIVDDVLLEAEVTTHSECVSGHSNNWHVSLGCYLLLQSNDMTYSEVAVGGAASLHPHLTGSEGPVSYSGIQHGVRPEGKGPDTCTRIVQNKLGRGIWFL